jgi:MFS family permease
MTLREHSDPGTARLPIGTLIAGCLAVCVAQIALAIPATLNGLFQEDLHPIGSQLTWISDAFLLPVTVLELTFGVLGDLFGRKQLLVGGWSLIVVGEVVPAASHGVHLLWAGQAIAGLGAAALFPTSLAMVAAGTRTHQARSRAIATRAASLSTGGFVAPVLGGITGNYGSWRWAFVVVTLIAVVSTLVSLLTGRELQRARRPLTRPGRPGHHRHRPVRAAVRGHPGPTNGWGSASVIIASAPATA